MFTEDRIRRFWEKVEKSGNCWEWKAGKDEGGYGRFHCPGWHDSSNTMVAAHRFSWVVTNDEIPNHDSYHGMCVLHKCDNPSCVNPLHLFLGTNEENVRDMDEKKRRVTLSHKGSTHSNSKLTESQVIEIYDLHKNKNISQLDLSKMYNVSHSNINHIFTGRNWSHLKLGEVNENSK